MKKLTTYSDLAPAEQRAFDSFIEGTNVEGDVDGYRRLLEVVCRQFVADHGGWAIQVFRDLLPPADSSKYLIWSGSHNAWWKPEGQAGYTTDRALAGVYAVEDLRRFRLDGTDNLDHQGRPTRCDVLVQAKDAW